MEKRKFFFRVGVAQTCLSLWILVFDFQTLSEMDKILYFCLFLSGLTVIWASINKPVGEIQLSLAAQAKLKKFWIRNVVLFGLVIVPLDLALIAYFKNSLIIGFAIAIALSVPMAFYLFILYRREIERLGKINEIAESVVSRC